MPGPTGRPFSVWKAVHLFRPERMPAMSAPDGENGLYGATWLPIMCAETFIQNSETGSNVTGRMIMRMIIRYVLRRNYQAGSVALFFLSFSSISLPISSMSLSAAAIDSSIETSM